VAEVTRELLERDGHVVLGGVLGALKVHALNKRIESAIDAWAADLHVSRREYLDVAYRWSSPNRVVDELAAMCAEALLPLVEGLVGPGHSPSRASVFRKSSAAAVGTHGHQDASYWVRPSSSRYALTTWVALDPADEERGALRVLPGSHRDRVGPPVDFLQPGFVDPASSWGDSAVTVDVEPGDVVVFGPRLWHASHAMVGGAVRRSLGIRWAGPSGSEIVARLPEPSTRFGMYTSGESLMRALGALAGRELPWGLSEVEWALEQGLVDGLPRAMAARSALRRLRLHLKAIERHRASGQRGMVWDAVRGEIVLPVLGPEVAGGTRP
jgi:hypothetical protein